MRPRITYSPVSAVIVERSPIDTGEVAVTVTPGSGEPSAPRTVPISVAVWTPCACTTLALISTRARHRVTFRMRFIMRFLRSGSSLDPSHLHRSAVTVSAATLSVRPRMSEEEPGSGAPGNTCSY